MSYELQEHFDKLKPDLGTTDTKFGEMCVYRTNTDSVTSTALIAYGELYNAELYMLSAYLKEESIFVDIGSNIGYRCIGITELTKCKVYGFEPNPDHFVLSAFNCQGKPIKLFHSALSSTKGTVKLPNDIEVPCKKLDEITEITEKIDAIKITTNGYEFEILKGSSKLIKKDRPIIMYHAMDMTIWSECYDFLKTKKYKQYWVTCLTKPIGENFKKVSEDLFGKAGVSSILAVPEENMQPNDLVEVLAGEDYSSTVRRLANYKILF